MIDYGFGVELDIIHKEHLDIIRDWRNDPLIWRWCRQNDLIYPEAQEKWYEAQKASQDVRFFSIYDTSEIIGVCGLTSIDLISRRAEFSLYIAPEDQGKNLSKPALKTLFAYGFKELGLKSIWGETFEDNRAKEIFKSLGMKQEGIRRQFYFKDGRFCDAILFSMLDEEFRYLEKEWTNLPSV